MKLFEYLTQQVLKWGITNLDCMIWPGAKNRGYGRVTVKYKAYYVHRLAYAMIKGEIPEGLEIDHTCEEKSCFNPAHLDAVTKSEHLRRTYMRMGKKTHCLSGHELTDDNLDLYNLARGKRICKQCHRDQSRKSALLRREKRNAEGSRLARNNTTGFKGVSKVSTGRFTAQITVNRKKTHLGSFDTAEEAVRAYDAANRQKVSQKDSTIK